MSEPKVIASVGGLDVHSDGSLYDAYGTIERDGRATYGDIASLLANAVRRLNERIGYVGRVMRERLDIACDERLFLSDRVEALEERMKHTEAHVVGQDCNASAFGSHLDDLTNRVEALEAKSPSTVGYENGVAHGRRVTASEIAGRLRNGDCSAEVYVDPLVRGRLAFWIESEFVTEKFEEARTNYSETEAAGVYTPRDHNPVSAPTSHFFKKGTAGGYWRNEIRAELSREIVERLRGTSATMGIDGSTLIADWIEREYLAEEED